MLLERKKLFVLLFTILLSACLQADSSICLTNACCWKYSLELVMMDGKTLRNMQSVIPK